MKKLRVITHGGVFHADEMSALALLSHYYGELDIVRDHTAVRQLGDYVIDVGGKYDKKLLMFDHHQDKQLPASNILVLNYLEEQGIVPSYTVDYLKERLFNFISDVDKGLVQKELGVPTINSIIRTFNGHTFGWDIAYEMIQNIVSYTIRNAEKFELDKIRWSKLERIGRVAVQDDDKFISGWQQLAEQDGINFLVTPSNRGGWNLISRDSELYPIPAHIEQTFLHNSGFMAVYTTKLQALDHAISISHSNTAFTKSISV